MPPAKFINGSYRRMEGDFFLAWPGFLDALGIEIERGRSINEGDR